MRLRNRTRALLLLCGLAAVACDDDDDDAPPETEPADAGPDAAPDPDAAPAPGAGEPDATVAGPCAIDDGECIFRHDTFGDEQLWTDVLGLNQVAKQMTPNIALQLGLKVDADAVPASVLANADLDSPATTRALLEQNAVIGLRANVEGGEVTSIGVTCALCHSTVDDSVAPGIGRRLDGWPNRDLDVGRILAITPGFPEYAASIGANATEARLALERWGPGRYDARYNLDGISAPVLLPPAYGLRDVPLETYTGDGPISYWNAYVAVTQMGAHGTFVDPRLGLDIRQTPDLLTPKLPALRDYQFSLEPPPPAGGFDAAAAARGRALFEGSAGCDGCHNGPAFTDAPVLHEPAKTGMDPLEAERSLTGMYRATPLRGAWHRAPYFHDGSAETLEDVVDHYDRVLNLGLGASEKADLAEYLRSL